MTLDLEPGDVGLLIGLLRYGYVRNPHPAYLANCSSDHRAAIADERVRADDLLDRLEAAAGLR